MAKIVGEDIPQRAKDKAALLLRHNIALWDICYSYDTDGGGGDLGYPSTVQLDDGTINTALYYAGGSEPSRDSSSGWGQVSCQLIKYTESDIINP